jgi:hypothetical protein
MARLRSRILWLKEGDANTKFFHMHARHRKRKNLVVRLRDDECILINHAEKAALVDQFFSNLIGRSEDRKRSIDLGALGLPTHNLADLDSPFTEQEVWGTIRTQESTCKAPGTDGQMGSLEDSIKCVGTWNIIKEDVLNAMSAIWSRNFANLHRLNTAYITMVPKRDGANQVTDFRPISVVHSFAKLVTKVLANRLAKRLNGMVSPIQSTFIQVRFIQDNFMLVQQTSRLLHQQNLATLLFKLDITKAFDSVSWPFLIEVMQQMGFGQLWRDHLWASWLFHHTSASQWMSKEKGYNTEEGLDRGIPFPQYCSFLQWMFWVFFSPKLKMLEFCSSCPEKRSYTESLFMPMMWPYSCTPLLLISPALLIFSTFLGMPLVCTTTPRNQMFILSDALKRSLWRSKIGCLVQLLPFPANTWAFLCPCTNYPNNSSCLWWKRLQIVSQAGRLI